ncbi:MAG: hypothetical protein ACI8QD_002654 [Cyclobacteriaceae bacterium]|jgi:hypothetical protein
MLNQHPDISAHHPPHLLKTFVPILGQYGSLQDSANKLRLIEDMCQWVEANPVTWQPIALNRQQINEQCHDIIDIFSFIYSAKAQQEGKQIWACKSTFNIEYAELLEPSVKPFYIYLYRDGRDVAASFMKAYVGPKHIYSAAKKWHKDQEQCDQFIQSLPEDRYHTLSYEKLVSEPERELVALCEKLGVDFSVDMLQYFTSNESKQTSTGGAMWANLVKPIMSENVSKYRAAFSEEELRVFESVAALSLERLGYEIETSADLKFEPSQIDFFSVIEDQRRKDLRKQLSEEELYKRIGQDHILKRIESQKRQNI